MPRRSQVASSSTPNTLPPKTTERRGGAKLNGNSTEVAVRNGAALDGDAHHVNAKAALRSLRKADRKAEEEQLRAAGKTIYTPAQVAQLTGLVPDETWSQRHMQKLVELAEFILPLASLREKGIAINSTYVVPGRAAVKQLIADLYGLYLGVEASPIKTATYDEIRGVLKNNGVTAHRDTPEPSLLVKAVFPSFDSKQVHLYSRSLEYAKQKGVRPDAFVKFVDDCKGFERIRVAAVESTGAHVKRKADKLAAKGVVAEVLEFERQHPFLTVSMLSETQRERLRHQDFTRVVVLAQVEYDRIKLYSTVPLTPDMHDSIERAFFTTAGEDADRLRRYLNRRKKWAAEQKQKYGSDWLTNGDRLSDEFLAAERRGVASRSVKGTERDTSPAMASSPLGQPS